MVAGQLILHLLQCAMKESSYENIPSHHIGKIQRPPCDIYVENVHLTDLTDRYGPKGISIRF